MELVETMTVETNVGFGAECRVVGSNPVAQVISTLSQRRAIREATNAALATCRIERLSQQNVSALSTGQRRLVELARVLAGDFRLLLLDEPSSGLDEHETERFGHILRDVVEERGLGILLVEHDMTLVMAVCAHIFVLDFGTLIFEGTPAATQGSDVVRRAYLGDEELASAP
jgi:ABC-type branched-subunit amino acid transport system ATPase component